MSDWSAGRSPAVARVPIVDIARVPLLTSDAATERAFAVLDERERAAAATRHERARRRYICAHAAVRTLIGERLGIDAAAVVLAVEPSGRPTTRWISYSLSHSGDRAAIAMTSGGMRIGVDLERVRERTRLDQLAVRVFTTAELDAWRALPRERRVRAFTVRWTELEAVLKARGTGIAGGLASAIAIPDGWSRTTFDAGEGCVGAVAVDGPEIEVTVRDFALE